jgi:hypothetical protein
LNQSRAADPNLPNIQGITPIMAAAGLGSNEFDIPGRFKNQPDQVACIDGARPHYTGPRSSATMT